MWRVPDSTIIPFFISSPIFKWSLTLHQIRWHRMQHSMNIHWLFTSLIIKVFFAFASMYRVYVYQCILMWIWIQGKNLSFSQVRINKAKYPMYTIWRGHWVLFLNYIRYSPRVRPYQSTCVGTSHIFSSWKTGFGTMCWDQRICHAEETALVTYLVDWTKRGSLFITLHEVTYSNLCDGPFL